MDDEKLTVLGGTGKPNITDNSSGVSVANSSDSSNLIPIELTEDLVRVTKFIFDKKSELPILSLNHKYIIISAVLQYKIIIEKARVDWIRD